MDELLAMVILGIIEGVTEFLPISSTGHLIVATDLMNRESVDGVTEIVIQLGAVLAVVWFYRADWGGRLLRLLKGPDRDLGWWGRLVIAAIPAAVLGFLLSDFITDVLFDPRVVAVAMIVGGIVLWLVDRYVPAREAERATTSLDRMTMLQALAVGIAQVVALIPGASRSASSIVGGLLVGLDRPTATAFSFYLAIPTLGGATLYSLLKHRDELTANGEAFALFVGIVAAFVTALIAVRWLLRYVAHHDFRWFALYRVVMGVIVLVIFAR